jgi:hypothetical protein
MYSLVRAILILRSGAFIVALAEAEAIGGKFQPILFR